MPEAALPLTALPEIESGLNTERAEAKEQAMEQYKEEQLRELRRQSQPKATAPKHTATAPKAGEEINVQPNLFGDDF